MEDPQLIIDYLNSEGLKYRATIQITSQKVFTEPLQKYNHSLVP